MPKECLHCGQELILKNKRDLTRKNYCSHHCRAKGAARTEAFRANTAKSCAFCGETFIARMYRQKYCSLVCCNKVAADSYRKRRAADLEGYFRNLIRVNSRRGGLTSQLLMDLFEKQRGKCALSGVDMTRVVGQGHVLTNISIDRIDSMRDYTPDNIQLVCHIINLMKHNMTNNELIDWCYTVVTHQER